MITPTPPPETHSHLQDAALRICRASHTPCPFGCAKDGAPNCHHAVHGGHSQGLCEPARKAQGAA